MTNLQEAADLNETVVISARRFEESPFISRQDTSKMVRGVYADRFHALFCGEDPVEKYWTLRRKALIFDVPEKPLEINGPDAVPFLNKVLSRQVAALQEGRGCYAIACTPQGGVFMDGVLFKLGTNRYWYVQADGAFDTWLIAHSEGFDVTITDPKSRVIQIQGPASIDIMTAASDGKIDENIRYFSAGYFDIGGQELFVSRTGFTGELGFEVYCDNATTNHLELWDHLISAGNPYGMEFSSSRAMTIRRIEAGMLGNLTDMDMTMTPFEAGLAPFIDMSKDDVIGRTALESRDRRPVLYGLVCEKATPTSGSIVLDNNTPVGHITSGIPSPTLDCGIGYIRFNAPGTWTGRMLQLRLLDGSMFPCEVVDLPFFDREKNIVRGMDRTIP